MPRPTSPPPGLAALDGLAPATLATLAGLVSLLSGDDAATSVSDPAEIWRVHIADSLSGIEAGELRGARRIADLGAGAGLPGLVLAAALPAVQVDLIESIGRKCEFIERAAGAAGIANARAVNQRAETLALGDSREAYDAVTARAVGRLATLSELASPLLKEGGVLVCWKGRRDAEEEAEAARAAERLAIEPEEVRTVGPYAGSRHRHIHRLRKNGPTPGGLPRRPGMAKKRPFGSEPEGTRTK
ncbi:MAG: 16S rRNA (guanine(527)-N(7))-methyltransferase RsmG [Solirubrobacterales bacterium]